MLLLGHDAVRHPSRKDECGKEDGQNEEYLPVCRPFEFPQVCRPQRLRYIVSDFRKAGEERVKLTAKSVVGRNDSVRTAMALTVWLSLACSLAMAKLILLSFCAMRL